MIGDLEDDAILLDRFARFQDEAAFGRLVERHGPAVLRACRRVLRCEHDVEDVFQATFLVLAGKADKLAWDHSVRAWLHSVAIRLALKARARSGLRRNRERMLEPAIAETHLPGGDPHRELERREICQVLDDALRQLPEKYRAPVVLCYLEGKTNAEAARELGWPSGSMSRRLERARGLLRNRLADMGLMVLLLACAAILVQRLAPDRTSLRPESAPAAGNTGVVPVLAHADIDADGVLRRLVRGDGQSPDSEQIGTMARNAISVAERIAEHDPGGNREIWRVQAARMREAAEGLGRAARMGDRIAILGTARHLDAACFQCHTVFRGVPGGTGLVSRRWIE